MLLFSVFSEFTTTGIGSMPHDDQEKACRIIIESFDIPFWPQFPKRSFKEAMVLQYTEGMPFVEIDSKRERIWIERDDPESLNKFYENYSNNLAIPVSENYASGFYRMLDYIDGKRFEYFKGQITGPLTFTLGLKDNEGKYLFYDEELREVALMLLIAKARWQIKELSRYADKVIIFVDEPVLSALGSSAYLGVQPEETLRLLRETIDSIKEEGAVSGIHCCGKADWEMVINAGPDILNFDAYDYFDSIEIYHKKLNDFLSRGCYLAWGIVPTTTEIGSEDIEGLYENFCDKFKKISDKIDRDLLLSKSMLTPSCGTGSLNVPEAEKVFSLLKGLKVRLTETFLN